MINLIILQSKLAINCEYSIMPTVKPLDAPIQLTPDVKSYVPLCVYQQNKEAIDRDFILRTTKEGEVMMHATDLLGLIPPAADLDLDELPLCHHEALCDTASSASTMSDVSMDDVASVSAVSIDDVAITVRAKWLPPDMAAAQSASNANVFGAYGTFELMDHTPNLVLPTVELDELSDADLEQFGATRLTPFKHTVPHFNTFQESLFVIVYDYSQEYVEKYVLKPELGGGWFIETHDFPHFFMPMRPDCAGSVILGKQISEDSETHIGTYKLISICIKFPQAVAIKSGVIHGNSGFTGPYAIPSNPHGTASIVLIHDDKDQIQTISQPMHKACSRFFKPSSTDTASAAAADVLQSRKGIDLQ